MQRLASAAFVTVLAYAVLAVPSGAATRAASVPQPAATRASGPGAVPAVQAPPVLNAAVTHGVMPTAAGIRRVLAPALKDPSLGPHVGAVVYDVARGKLVYGLNTAGTFTPASTMKVLTTTAALATLGPDHRFTTKVVSGATASSIVLVGGGDPLLTARPPASPGYPKPATLADLATATAKALEARGVRRVALGFDPSLFSGPAVNQHWLPRYTTEGIVSPTSALWVDEGREKPGLAKRAEHPALVAATAFAARLKLAGIAVGAAPVLTKAKPGAATLAQVRSAPLAAITEHVNLVSDNDGAEVLLRHIGLATHNGGSYAGGIKGLRSTLTRLGVTLGKARIEDGSGLSRTNAVPLQLLAGAVRAGISKDHPELRAVPANLPVAAFSGSLSDRFAGPGAAAGAGYVRAKTGTLTSVHSLAGLVRDRTGTLLVFALATDRAAPDKALAARAALDRAAAALATCGCA